MQRQRTKKDLPCVSQVEFVFYNEAEIQNLIYEYRLDYRRPELPNGSGLSDPTASAAIRSLVPVPKIKIKGYDLQYPERWLDVVDLTYTWCLGKGEHVYQAAKRRYKGEYYYRICSDLYMSENIFYTLIDKVRVYATIQAAQLNLIYVN